MDKQSYGAVVAMEFRRPPSVAFRDIVEEFDIAFQMADTHSRALTWEDDDIALIDRDKVRVGLGWLPGGEPGRPTHLVVAVGTPPGAEEDCRIDPRSFRYLAERIAERTREYLPYTAVLHGEAHQPVGRGLIDTTFALLRIDSTAVPGTATGRQGAHWQRADDEPAQAHDRSGGALWERLGGESLSHFLHARAEPTQPLRLTVHTLALSLCLYVPPLGAAAFTYTMLRDIFPLAAQSV